MSKVMITGGTGAFGKSLLYWLKNNIFELEEVIILAREPEKIFDYFDESDLPFKLSLLKHDILLPLPTISNVNYIIHCASPSSSRIGIERPKLMRDIIVDGTKNILEYSRLINLKKLLFISSGAVYGEQPENLLYIPEDYNGSPNTLDPLNAYGCAKRQAENLCALYRHKYMINFNIARCFSFVGPYFPLDEHFAIGNFIRDGLKNIPIKINSNGKSYRSYLYSDELAEFLWKIMIEGKIAEAYNVGSDKEISINNLAKLVCICFEKDINFKKKKFKTNRDIRKRYIPNIEKSKNEFGLKKLQSLKVSIKKTIKFHQLRRA